MTDDGFEIGFDASNIECSLTVAGLFSPFLPSAVATWLCIIVIGLAAVIHLLFWHKRHKAFCANATDGLGLAITSDQAKFSFNLSTSTIFLLVLGLAWISATGGLWVLGNFFIVFVAAHSACVTYSSILDLADLRDSK